MPFKYNRVTVDVVRDNGRTKVRQDFPEYELPILYVLHGHTEDDMKVLPVDEVDDVEAEDTRPVSEVWNALFQRYRGTEGENAIRTVYPTAYNLEKELGVESTRGRKTAAEKKAEASAKTPAK